MQQSSLDLNLSTKKTRKQELLTQLYRVVPWAVLVEFIGPYHPEGKNGRPPFETAQENGRKSGDKGHTKASSVCRQKEPPLPYMKMAAL
jgi:hypothetical protein